MTQILVDSNENESRVILDEDVNSNDLTNAENEEIDRDIEDSTSEEVNSSSEETEQTNENRKCHRLDKYKILGRNRK